MAFGLLAREYCSFYFSSCFLQHREQTGSGARTVPLLKLLKVVVALGIHLFPFRTEKLSPMAPMVLHTKWESR